MTVNLSIKNVPESLAEKLRRRAEANHRSLQGELMALLERELAAPIVEQVRAGYHATEANRPRPATLREIYESALVQQSHRGPSSVELLAEARAEREAQIEALLSAPDAYARARAIFAGLSAPSGRRQPVAKPSALRTGTVTPSGSPKRARRG